MEPRGGSSSSSLRRETLLLRLVPSLGPVGSPAADLHPEALSFPVDVAQTQVDVRADALHRLYGQRAAQVLGVGPGGGQAEAEPAGHRDGFRGKFRS